MNLSNLLLGIASVVSICPTLFHFGGDVEDRIIKTPEVPSHSGPCIAFCHSVLQTL